MGYPVRYKFSVTQNIVQNVEHSFVTYSDSRAVHRRSASNNESTSWSVLFSTCGRPVRRLSWVASLPYRNVLTNHATVRYGNTALPHASHSPWRHSCVLRPRATSILIKESCSNFQWCNRKNKVPGRFTREWNTMTMMIVMMIITIMIIIIAIVINYY